MVEHFKYIYIKINRYQFIEVQHNFIIKNHFFETSTMYNRSSNSTIRFLPCGNVQINSPLENTRNRYRSALNVCPLDLVQQNNHIGTITTKVTGNQQCFCNTPKTHLRNTAQIINNEPLSVIGATATMSCVAVSIDVKTHVPLCHSLSFMYSNVRSICNKISEFNTTVSILNPDIICLSETWLTPKLCNGF